MYVLGIETSCDETSAAIVKDGKTVFSNEIISSLEFHRLHGGVIPEIAFRMQLETISAVADAAVKDAKIKKKDIGLISVTQGPGLLGSLLVGISFAKALSLALNVPVLGVNHVYSHMYANFLNTKGLKLPFVALVVSGGHTSLFYIEDFDKIKLLGSTCDDACGETFDKVAKILELGYPGGPLIEQMAKKGDSGKIKFGCSNTNNPLDFSFSGIKTAVLYKVTSQASQVKSKKEDIAASFQETAIDTLIRKSLLACKHKKVKQLAVGGGVIANSRLRDKFLAEAKKNNINCYFPSREFCTDNAAMVAGLGYKLFKKGYVSDLFLSADLN